MRFGGGGGEEEVNTVSFALRVSLLFLTNKSYRDVFSCLNRKFARLEVVTAWRTVPPDEHQNTPKTANLKP